MGKFLATVICAVLLATQANAAPASAVGSSSFVASESGTATATGSAAESSFTVAPASDAPNGIMWNVTTDNDPQPIRGSLGGTILAQQNADLQRQNPDLLAPPTTDEGDMYVFHCRTMRFLFTVFPVCPQARILSGHSA